MRKDPPHYKKEKRSVSDKSFTKRSSDVAKDSRPSKKTYDKGEDKPFKKPYAKDGDKPFRSKSEDSGADRPFKKPYAKDGDKPFRSRSEDSGTDRPFKKPYAKNGDKPFRSRSEDSGTDRPFKRPYAKDGDKPFRSRSEDSDADRPFKRPYAKDGDKPFRSSRSEDSGADRPFKKPYAKNGDKPFRSRTEDSGADRPFKKPYAKNGDKPFRSRSEDSGSTDRPFKKPYAKDGDKPFRSRSEDSGADRPKRTYDKDRKPFAKDAEKPSFRAKKEEKADKPHRDPFDKQGKYATDVDGNKLPPKKAKPVVDDVSFSRSIDDGKPEEKPVPKPYERKKDDRPFRDRPKADDAPKPRVRVRRDVDVDVEDEKEKTPRSDTARKDFDRHPEYAAKKATPNKRTVKGSKRDEDKYEDGAAIPEQMPLNKYIAHSGEASRREAAEFVKQGKVKVNNELVLDPGHKVMPGDQVTLIGKKLTPTKGRVYILMNKPKGYITTNDDPQGRRTVMELMGDTGIDRLFPVGRLDRDTTGLLLITNDGALTQKLSHPSNNVKKVYHVTLDKPLTKADFEKVIAGQLELEDGKVQVDEMAYLEKKNELGLEIHSGKNRIVRRIFESMGYVVEKLDRMMYAGLTKKNLPRGKWRNLEPKEVILLNILKANYTYRSMSFITAERIHDGNSWLPQGSVIETAADGTIVAIHNGPVTGAIVYEGILAPGLVNAHCHLELSHMKGAIPEHTGLIPFLKHIPQHRNDYTEEQKKQARHNGHKELLDNGVVAVGDICNTADMVDVRALGQMHFHSFVEALGFHDHKAPGYFGNATNAYNAYAAQAAGTTQLRQSVVPHAPYTVSSALFRLIDAHDPGALISIHNQESADEDLYYKSKSGQVPELLSLFGIDDSAFVPSGRSSLQTYLPWMSPQHPFLFVHNTSSQREDVQFAHSRLGKAYWCLCPNANKYIEDRLPDVDMLMSENARICIGTDSLSSNHRLSVLAELYTLKQNFPHLSWELLLQWGTANGAQALQMDSQIGTIEKGKKPGIVQMTGLDTHAEPVARRVV